MVPGGFASFVNGLRWGDASAFEERLTGPTGETEETITG